MGYTPTGIPTHTESWIKEDLRRKDQIIFPIHIASEVHWSLIVVETRTKTVNYFDSLERTRIFHMSPVTIKKFMEEYYKDRGETVIFRIRRRIDAPLQENGYDCGVFLCQNAERITQELLEGRINPDWRMVNWVKEVRKNQENRN